MVSKISKTILYMLALSAACFVFLKTIDTLAQCRTRVGNGDAESGSRFTQHMARWRNHIYDLASGIRQKGMSD